jgi:hypothetical protein
MHLSWGSLLGRIVVSDLGLGQSEVLMPSLCKRICPVLPACWSTQAMQTHFWSFADFALAFSQALSFDSAPPALGTGRGNQGGIPREVYK